MYYCKYYYKHYKYYYKHYKYYYKYPSRIPL